MQKTGRIISYIWIVSLFIYLFLLVFSNVDVSRFFNSDTLYLPSIYKDLFLDGNSFAGWQLNPAPNFFPDMLGYFVLEWICGGNFILASFIYPIIQFLVLLILFRLILLQIFERNLVRVKFLGGVIMLSFFFLIHVVKDDFETTFQLLTNSYHLGAMLNAFIATLLLLAWIKPEKKIKTYVLITFVVLAVISDKLFIIQFVLGAIIILLVRFYDTKSKIYKKGAIVVFSSAVFGLLLFKLIQKIDWINFSTSPTMFSFDKIGDSFKIFMAHNWELLTSSVFGFVIVLIPLLSLIGLTLFCIKKIRLGLFSSLFYFYFGSLCFMSFTLLAPIMNGSYEGFDCLRYTIGFYFVGMLVFPFLFLNINVETKNWHILLGLLNITFLLPFHTVSINNLSTYFNYQDTYAETLDKLKDKHNLKAGIANYWYAKKNTMFSHNDVRIYAVYNDFDIYTHVTNRNWYHENIDNQLVVFNFVIIDEENRMERVKELFPTFELVKQGEVTICIVPDFIFPRGKTKLQILEI